MTYTSPEHFELVEKRLAEGYSEYALRAVIVYAVDVKGFADEKMRGNLSPQTLFGKNFTTYLDPARSEYAREIAEGEAGAA